jgi:hypothetical protein
MRSACRRCEMSLMPTSHETIRLLEQVRSDFDRLRVACAPIKMQLEHKATDAQAEGVEGIPYDVNGAVAFGSAGHREAFQRCDSKSNPLFREDPIFDANGKPIENSAGEAFDIVMPAFRSTVFSGASDDYRKLEHIAERGGRLIAKVEISWLRAALAGWRFSKHADLWWTVVFEIGWSKRHPLLNLERRLWLPSEVANVFVPYDLEQLRHLSNSGFGPGKAIPAQWLERLPEAFVSELPDAVSACFDAVDYILSEIASSERGDDSSATEVAINALIAPQIRRRFAVALTFPGEKREIVEPVADRLANALGQTRIFYDRFHEVELSRLNLDLLLQDFYRDDSDLIVVFVCGQYSEKEWCGIEWRAVRELMKSHARADEDVMIIRLDDSPLKGLSSLDGYLNVREKTPRQIADAIIKRWSATR